MTDTPPPAVDVAAVRARLKDEAEEAAACANALADRPICDSFNAIHDLCVDAIAALDQQQREIERLTATLDSAEAALRETCVRAMTSVDRILVRAQKAEADLAAAQARSDLNRTARDTFKDDLDAVRIELAAAQAAEDTAYLLVKQQTDKLEAAQAALADEIANNRAVTEQRDEAEAALAQAERERDAYKANASRSVQRRLAIQLRPPISVISEHKP